MGGHFIPKLTNTNQVHQSQSGWSPVYVNDTLSIMSVGFLLPGPDHAVIWRGPRKNALIRQLLTDVAWTEEDGDKLDVLLIDTPPGTSDEHLSVVQYLQAADCLAGAVIVTTPQEVALSDVRKVSCVVLVVQIESDDAALPGEGVVYGLL